MLSQSEVSKLVLHQTLVKLESQIKKTEDHLKSLGSTIELLKQSDVMGKRNREDAVNFAAIKLERLHTCPFSRDSKEWADLAAAAQRAQDLVWNAENNYLESQEHYQGCLNERDKHTEALKKLKDAYQQHRISYVNLCYEITHSGTRKHSTAALSAEEQRDFLQTEISSLPGFSR